MERRTERRTGRRVDGAERQWKRIRGGRREDSAEVGQSAGEACLSQISGLLPARRREKERVRKKRERKE